MPDAKQEPLLPSPKQEPPAAARPRAAQSSSDQLLIAIETARELNIWPSAAHLAELLGYKQKKLAGDVNRLRKRILREKFGF